MDNWYGSQKLIARIDNLENIFFLNNLLVDDTKKAEMYKQIEKVQYKKSEVKLWKLNFLRS